MKTKTKNANGYSTNKLSAAKIKELDYIENFLQKYVEAYAEPAYKFHQNSQWHIIPDFETRILNQTIEVIRKEEFTLDELYYVFMQHGYYGYETIEGLEEAKLESIDFIRDVEDYDKEDFARIKSKIEAMDLIMFGLILYLIHTSSILFDKENETSIVPEINN